MQKREFIEIVRKSLLKDENPKIVEKFISLVYNGFVLKYYQESGGNVDGFIKRFDDVEVKQTTSGSQYSDLPVRILELPLAGGGVRSIEYADDADIDFIPVTLDRYKTLTGLMVGQMKGPIPYITTNGKVEYKAHLYGVNSVSMRLLVVFDDLLPTDEVHFPPGAEISIQDLVLQLLQRKPFPDKVIDNNKMTR